MNSSYQGMKWFKCDLQVQTPEDNRHWADDDLRLGSPRRPRVEGQKCEKNIQEKARAFLRRCHELGLDVIGITDHNFSRETEPRDWFITHLVEQNRVIAENLGRSPLVIFPGFEVDIGYHVLCLFSPATKQSHLEQCNRNLTKLGLDEQDRFTGGRPNLLRKDSENVSLKTLISHVQGEMGGIVIAAHADQTSGMLKEAIYREDFQLPDLYCVEVTQNPPSQRYLDILNGKNSEWERDGFYPAYIMSSDAKSLKAEKGGLPKPNSLGYRHTWIKMSEPSIESLRQAFLDSDSRIRLPDSEGNIDKNPAEEEIHPYIRSIKIEGAEFLDNQEIVFSPNKNSLIGGRGSGKSTVIEYLRLALGKISVNPNEQGKDKSTRIRRTTQKPGFKAFLNYHQKYGVNYYIELNSEGAKILDDSVTDQKTAFDNLPAQFFSQQELNKITESDEVGQIKSVDRLLQLVDGFVLEDLNKLEEEQERLESQIKNKQRLKNQKRENVEKINSLQQEISDLQKQWQARNDVRSYADKHSKLKVEQGYVDSFYSFLNCELERLKISVSNINESFIEPVSDDTPNSKWFKKVAPQIFERTKSFKSDVITLLEAFKQEINEVFTGSENWLAVSQQLKKADEEFAAACAQKGISPDDIKGLTVLAETKSEKEKEVFSLVSKNEDYKLELSNLAKLETSLQGVWDAQFKLRLGAAAKANKLAVYEESNKSFVSVDVIYQKNKQVFLQNWEKLKPVVHQRKLAREWMDIGSNIFDDISVSVGESIWEVFYRKIEKDPELAELKAEIDAQPSDWEEICFSRVPDAVDITLYRDDGSEAGKISEDTLSDGQRNTAVLALLLAQTGGPLIIDQPEDELDSNFVFNELIPMIRRMKSKRQLIFATHNANLPVNGDADLVYAFEARDGKGVCKAQGGLDRENVAKAVLDIMEGSEKAFMRRRVKYGF